MQNLNITVANKVATYVQRDGFIVCGNKDYKITFTFDSEWDEHTVKTARFKWKGTYTDVLLVENVVEVPKISNATEVEVGVFAGDLCTTTPALIPCVKSILCDEGAPKEPTPDVYSQLMDMLTDEKIKGPPGEQGPDGKSAYEVAQDNGFEGTADEWLNSLIGNTSFKMKRIPSGGKFTITPGMLALVIPYGEFTLSAHKSDGTTVASSMGATMLFSAERDTEIFNNDYWVAFLYASKSYLTTTVSQNHNRYAKECYIQNNYKVTGSETGMAYVYYIS